MGAAVHARIEERWKMVINTRRRREEPESVLRPRWGEKKGTNRHTCDSSLELNNNEIKESKKKKSLLLCEEQKKNFG